MGQIGESSAYLVTDDWTSASLGRQNIATKLHSLSSVVGEVFVTSHVARSRPIKSLCEGEMIRPLLNAAEKLFATSPVEVLR